MVILISFDIDGTLEVGDPPGVLTMDMVRRAQEKGCVIGSCSDRPRSRFWMHSDCIQQLQGRAGARQVTGVKPEIAVSGGPMPLGGNFTVWSATPD